MFGAKNPDKDFRKYLESIKMIHKRIGSPIEKVTMMIKGENKKAISEKCMSSLKAAIDNILKNHNNENI